MLNSFISSICLLCSSSMLQIHLSSVLPTQLLLYNTNSWYPHYCVYPLLFVNCSLMRHYCVCGKFAVRTSSKYLFPLMTAHCILGMWLDGSIFQCASKWRNNVLVKLHRQCVSEMRGRGHFGVRTSLVCADAVKNSVLIDAGPVGDWWGWVTRCIQNARNYVTLELGDSAESRFDSIRFTVVVSLGTEAIYELCSALSNVLAKLLTVICLRLAVNAQWRKYESKKTFH